MRRLAALALCLVLLAGCGPREAREDGRVHILCTTYPVYLFTTALTEGAEDVSVELLVDQQTSCLHDYTLTVRDMKTIDRADVMIVNGAGLEEFLEGALAQKDAPVIDCSAGVDLLPALGHHHHDDEEDGAHEDDPHIWMDPHRAVRMLENIAGGLEAVTGGDYGPALEQAREQVLALAAQPPEEEAPPLITFHDGFQYFSAAFGLELARAIEEEEGAEASAQELKALIQLVREGHIPAIFVEKNGSRRSAGVIARETGCKVYELDMVMSGDEQGLEPYLRAIRQNLTTIREATGQ